MLHKYSRRENKFLDICKKELNFYIQISNTRMLTSGKGFAFTLNTFRKVLIYIQKNYTNEDQNTRYQSYITQEGIKS